jgi:DNA-binding response OmpR family regulator
LTALIEYEILLKDVKRLSMRLIDEALGAVEFGRFRLLPYRRELRADGVAVELGSRAFDILTVLIEARGAP